jgi:spore coat polysaccharide biosynthesis predicted glycosyltransferase SpsG
MLARDIAKEVNVLFIVGENSPSPPDGFKSISIGKKANLIQTLSLIRPDLLIRDTGPTISEEVEKIRSFVTSLLHFDDFGDGGKHADFVFQILQEEAIEEYADNYVVDRKLFMADPEMKPYEKSGLRKTSPGALPHLVISFGEEDEGNLTYRALRHVSQLQIPLKVTVIVGEGYRHDVSTLRMMALGRRNTLVQQPPYSVPEIYATADVILCASGYMPYEVGLAFPKDQHGFVHLGLGRKVKQSNLLNAIMEPLLHEPLRKRSIERQLSLGLGNGKDAIIETIHYLLEHPKSEADRKALSDMLN